MGLLDDLTMHGHDIENNPHPSDGVLVDDMFLRIIDDPELKEDSPLERYVIQRFKDVTESQIISGKMEGGEILITDDWDTCLTYYEKLVSAMDGTGSHEKAREIIAKDFEGKITIEEKDTFVDLINKCEKSGCALDAESFVEQGRLAKVAEVEEEIQVAIKTGQDVGYRGPEIGTEPEEERVEEVAREMVVEKAKSAGQESMINDDDTVEQIINLCNNSGHAINEYELREQAYTFAREELIEKLNEQKKDGLNVIKVDPMDDARKMLESIQGQAQGLVDDSVPLDDVDEEDTEDA